MRTIKAFTCDKHPNDKTGIERKVGKMVIDALLRRK